MTPAQSQSLCVYCRERPVEPKFRPFCSERCRLLDLSRWLAGDYRIAGESPEDQVEDQAAAQSEAEPMAEAQSQASAGPSLRRTPKIPPAR